MPWKVEKSSKCSAAKPWAVIKIADGSIIACHPSKEAGLKQAAALYANEPSVKELPMSKLEKSVGDTVINPEAASAPPRDFAPPRDNLVRAQPGGFELRAADDGAMPTLVGHFAVFDQWTEIDSAFEGHFMERIAPDAFNRTFANNRERMKVTFNHGKDPQIGDKVLGPISVLEADKIGARYEVPLLDTSYNRDLAPGLEAGLYGSSFRFSVHRQDKEASPPKSAHNPDGIPERTIREAHVYEFGPVTYPAYVGATAGVRSLTDIYVFDQFTRDPKRLAALIDSMRSDGEAPPDDGLEAEPHSDAGPAEVPEEPPPIAEVMIDQGPPEGGSSDSEEKSVPDDKDKITRADRPARIKELTAASERFVAEHDGELSADLQKEWADLTGELVQLNRDEAAYQQRLAWVKTLSETGSIEDEETTTRTYAPPTVLPAKGSGPRVRDIYSRAEIRLASRNAQDERELTRDSAKRAIEAASFNHMDRATGQTQVEKTLQETEDPYGYIPQRILLTGNPVYRRGLHKTLLGMMLNPEEMAAYSDFQEFERGMGRFESERAMGQVTGSAGGFGVTFDLDPTMIQTSTGAVVPYRRACRVVTVTTNEWRGVTSGGVVASYAAEAAVGTDNSPTLAQPAALVQKAHCFVPFSMEIQGDYQGLEAELGREIQDAKDVLEAVQFTTGAGTTVFPQGIVTGASTAYTTATTLVLAAADLYGTEFTLSPRFRQNAQWFANRAFYNRIRQIDTAGGAQLWTQDLRQGIPRDQQGNTGMLLLGYPANEASGFSTSIATTTKMAVFGAPNYFVIVDRVGMNLELVPILTQQATAGTGFGIPTGQRGVYAWWRNTSKVLSANAFLTVTGL